MDTIHTQYFIVFFYSYKTILCFYQTNFFNLIGDGVQSPSKAFPPEEDQDATEGEQDATCERDRTSVTVK